MRQPGIACSGDHAIKSSARKSEALTVLYLADPTASKAMKLATLDAGTKHATVEVITQQPPASVASIDI
jgi:hypothetical protein